MKDFCTMVAAFVAANLIAEWIRKRFLSGSIETQQMQTGNIEDCADLNEVYNFLKQGE